MTGEETTETDLESAITQLDEKQQQESSLDSAVLPESEVAPEPESASSKVTEDNSSNSDILQEKEYLLPNGELNIPAMDKAPLDFWPVATYKRPETLEEHLEERRKNVNQILSLKEQLKLLYLNKGIHIAYYRQWIAESNANFRSVVRTKKRIEQLSKKEVK